MFQLKRFVMGVKTEPSVYTAVSLYSGAGLSDFGYRAAGFEFLVQAELDPYRAALGKDNFPGSEWIVGDIRCTWSKIVKAYKKLSDRPLDLLVVTPPCQGMSSSNPSRGKRQTRKAEKNEEQNSLLLAALPIINRLKP